jgi:hypothetical protein
VRPAGIRKSIGQAKETHVIIGVEGEGLLAYELQRCVSEEDDEAEETEGEDRRQRCPW